MKSLRAVFRMLLIGALTLSLVIVWVTGLLFTVGRPSWRVRWRGWIVSTWASGVTRIIGLRAHVTGTPPEPPFSLVSNHLSYIDILLLHSRLRAVFVSKAEVGSWPVIGWLARTYGTLFIDRRNKKDVLRINSMIQHVLDRGDGVVFFPEGTTHKGDHVYPFKASLLDLAARTELPVHYATISYRTPPGQPPAHKSICWWGDMTFGDHAFNLLKMPYFDALLHFGAETVRADDRKALAQHLEAHVRRHFVPVVIDSTP